MANRHVKIFSTSLAVMELHSKAIMRYHVMSTRMAVIIVIFNGKIISSSKNLLKLELAYTVAGNIKWYSHFQMENNLVVSHTVRVSI